MKKALVTGGCGFIGSSIAKKLVSEGWLVDVVDNMSGGQLESLAGQKIRVLPDSSFISHFYRSLGPSGQAIARNARPHYFRQLRCNFS